MKNSKNHIITSEQLDKSIRAQDDFFAYVNKKWVDVNPIPDSETRWGTFNILRDEAWENMHQIYKELQDSDYANGSIEQQAKDFFYTGMNYDTFEEKHLSIIKGYMKDVDDVLSIADLSLLIAKLHDVGIGDPWLMYVDADEKDSTSHILRFRQSGLTLPNRDYYLEEDSKMEEIRQEYQKHARNVYTYFPELDNNVDLFWQSIWDIEYGIATISRSKVDLRDVEKNYNIMTFAEFSSNNPNLDLTNYVRQLNVPAVINICVDQPEFFEYLNTQFTDENLIKWKIYIKWQIVLTFYGIISEKYANLRFEFGKILNGTKEMLPLWKRVVLMLDDAIGEGAGRLYAEKHFPESSKKEVLKLVENVRDAYEERINKLDWMSSDTKLYAVKKLRNIKVLIGYPDKWRDFSRLKVARNSYLENIIESERFDTNYVLQKLNEPVSRDEWFMNPQTVNAYHDPNRLVICFPAAILQKPFYSPEAHISENMGGIGTVIAHEFTHGFDDQGCQFDAEGNLRTWQTEAEREAFNKKANIIISQADKHEVIPTVFLKGKLVIGESIADLGGIEISLHALLNNISGDEEIIPGVTAKQAFFIAYAQTECGHVRDEKAREFALTDPHPDSVFRVNGIVQHSDDWHDTYDVKPSDELYRAPKDRARIW